MVLSQDWIEPVEAPGADEVDRSVSHAARGRPWNRYLEMGLGLRNYWYAAFFSDELAEGETHAEEICGERIIFKRVKGKVYGLQDRCVHRGVAFSARPECHSDNTLTCWFHGFTYDVRDGKLVQILSQPDSALIGKMTVPTYPVEEAFRLVWVYIGDGEPIPFEKDLPAVLQRVYRGEERRAFHPLVRVRIACDWRLAFENGFDPGHVYGHRTADIVRRGLVKLPLSIYPDAVKTLWFDESDDRAKAMYGNQGVWKLVWEADIEGQTVYAPQPDKATDEDVTFYDSFSSKEEIAEDVAETGGGVCYMPCMFEATGFPDGRQSHLEWFVPVDEHHHNYTIMQSVRVRNDEEEERFHQEADDLWGPLVWSTDPNVVGFNNYDAFGREQVAHGYDNEDFWHRERFYKPDFALTQWRMFVSKHARAIQRRGDFAPKRPQEPSVVLYANEPGAVR